MAHLFLGWLTLQMLRTQKTWDAQQRQTSADFEATDPGSVLAASCLSHVPAHATMPPAQPSPPQLFLEYLAHSDLHPLPLHSAAPIDFDRHVAKVIKSVRMMGAVAEMFVLQKMCVVLHKQRSVHPAFLCVWHLRLSDLYHSLRLDSGECLDCRSSVRNW